MKLIVLLLQLVLTIPLTLILNYLSKKDNNSINMIIIPSIYMLVVSALIPMVKEYAFLVVIFEILVRNFYVTNISSCKVNNTKFVLNTLLSIGLSLVTYLFYINKVDNVLPSPNEIKPFLWFIIVIYIYKVIGNVINSKDNVEKSLVKRSSEYIVMQYAKFKNKYGKFVISDKDIINNLVYAIMIHEDCNKSSIVRKFNEYVGSLGKKETKYGIMQVLSYNHISDEESITIVIGRLEDKLKKLKKKEQVDLLLDEYDLVDKEDIINIYNEIVNFVK